MFLYFILYSILIVMLLYDCFSLLCMKQTVQPQQKDPASGHTASYRRTLISSVRESELFSLLYLH